MRSQEQWLSSWAAAGEDQHAVKGGEPIDAREYVTCVLDQAPMEDQCGTRG